MSNTKSTKVGDRVVVTGAAGFIASHLVDELLARGHEVTAIDRRSVDHDAIAAANLADAIKHPRLNLRKAELSIENLEGLLTGVDTVFHLAAVPGVRSSWDRFNDYVTSNVFATHRLLDACQRANVRRFVYASSSSVYGITNSPSREGDVPCPISPYGVSKLAAEHLCMAHVNRQEATFSVAALRYFTVYGPRQRSGMAINQALLAAMTGVPVPLYGDGRQRREFTYVSDAVAATLAAAEVETTAAVVNVGGGSSVTMLEVLELANEVTGQPLPIFNAQPQAGDVSSTEADLLLANRLLGYEPTVGLKEGMSRQAEWLAGLPEALRLSLLPNQLEVVR